ncbi:MAG: hypothetical protein AAB909_03075 [Patescibacteria group bacterium]
MGVDRKQVLDELLVWLEEMAQKNSPDPKYWAQLRTAERSFNFLLDVEVLSSAPGTVDHIWLNDLKKRRDEVANEITKTIKGDQRIQKRFEAFCDFMKDPGTLGSML